jgi:hypothetical protein
MLANQMFYGTFIIALMVVFHVAGLVALSKIMQRVLPTSVPASASRSIVLLTIAVIGIITIHSIEVWGWAGVYLWIGEFSEVKKALYFSVTTATTLGYGDLTLSSQWQILGTFEAMGGLILFGVSTAFLLELMRRVFEGSKVNG